MREITIRPGDVINLGRQGENNALRVRFCVSGWAEAYGSGTFSLIVQTPGSSDTYDASVTVDGRQVLWTVPQIVTLEPGQGFCQLSYHVDGGLAKSEIYRTIVTPSMGPVVGPISDSEAWAIGERDGVPVTQGDPTYQNNSKYYAEMSENYAKVSILEADNASNHANAAAAHKAAAQEAGEEALAAKDAAQLAAQQAALYVGAPLVAGTAAGMTDQDRIYVYTGSETGYVYGDWYYWDGAQWADGGVYNSAAIQTDPTLSVSGMPADAKVTGDYVKGMSPYNAYDVLTPAFPHANATVSGTTFSFSGRTCVIEGGTGSKVLHLLQNTPIPDGVIPGKYIYGKIDSNNEKARFRISFLDSEQTLISTLYFTANTEDAVLVPSGAVYWRVTIYCAATWASTDTATMVFNYLLSAKSNKSLEEVTENYIKGAAPYNSADVLCQYFPVSDYTAGGISFAWSGRTCSISGQFSSGVTGSVDNFVSKEVLPVGVEPGSYVYYLVHSDNANVRFRIGFYDANGNSLGITKYATSNVPDRMKIPEEAAKWALTVYVGSGWTGQSTAEMTLDYLLSQPSNKMLEKEIGSAPNFANEFKSDTNYGVGEYVLKDFVLYRFTKNHEAGEWNASEATEVTIGGELETVHEYGAVDLLDGTFNGSETQTTSGIHYQYAGDHITAWGTATEFSAYAFSMSNPVTDEIESGDTLQITYDSTNENVYLRISFRDSEENWIRISLHDKNNVVTVPENAVIWTASICVDSGKSAGTSEDPAVVSEIRVMNSKTNKQLTDKYNYLEPKKPLYVAIGASTTQGAVHYYSETQDDVSHLSRHKYPEYAGEVLGLDVVNLSIGGTGLIQRTRYNLKNHMDKIYTNDAVLSKASLVTIGVSAGNDLMTPAAPIGVYDDYYPYDAEGYHPSGFEGVSQMIARGATICGALNWCIKWLGDHYPKAQIIIQYGIFGYNIRRSAVLDDSIDPPKKLIFTDEEAIWGRTLHAELLKLVDALNIPMLDFYKGAGLPYTYYAANARDENGDYVIFSTTKSDGVKVRNGHPNDAGYEMFERYLAGQIAQLFYR